jgi:hypothetical protein
MRPCRALLRPMPVALLRSVFGQVTALFAACRLLSCWGSLCALRCPYPVRVLVGYVSRLLNLIIPKAASDTSIRSILLLIRSRSLLSCSITLDTFDLAIEPPVADITRREWSPTSYCCCQACMYRSICQCQLSHRKQDVGIQWRGVNTVGRQISRHIWPELS